MILILAPRAQRDLAAALKWWAKNRRTAPTLLADELDAAFDLIKATPDLAPLFVVKRGKLLRRVLLPKTKGHVYFQREGANEIRILRILGAGRGREPQL